MPDQLKHFERWRRRLPENTAFFVNLIETEVVPLFLARGYSRHSNYPGKANWLPLQRRSGEEWPTVELQFGHRGRPFVRLDFSCLPEPCRTLDRAGFRDIPRIKACVVDAPAFFSLCKGRSRINDTVFGDASIFLWTIWLKQKLRNEVAELKSLSEWLIEFLDQGIPREWFHRNAGGRVNQHVIMNSASRIFRDRQSSSQLVGWVERSDTHPRDERSN